MKITWDPKKRAETLKERALDFMDATHVFSGRYITATDDRCDYGEVRNISVGFLRKRMVIVGWVQRGQERHIFTMRKANGREIRKYQKRFEES